MRRPPDVVVICGEPQFYDERRDILTNPTVVSEVLSPSTEAYDRGEKFLRYRTQIETLQEYFLVSQHRPLVEHYVRQPDGSWSYLSATGLDEAVDLVSIGCRLPSPKSTTASSSPPVSAAARKTYGWNEAPPAVTRLVRIEDLTSPVHTERGSPLLTLLRCVRADVA
jgi:hypothetical protein